MKDQGLFQTGAAGIIKHVLISDMDRLLEIRRFWMMILILQRLSMVRRA